MTGLKVTQVNVRIQGLKLEAQAQPAGEPELARVN